MPSRQVELNVDGTVAASPATGAAIESAIRGLDDVDFIILQEKDQHYFQSAGVTDGYVVEWREGSEDRHFSASLRETTVDGVLQAAQRWLSREPPYAADRREQMTFDPLDFGLENALVLKPDQFLNRHVGAEADGTLFWLTFSFDTWYGTDGDEHDLALLYRFEPDGELKSYQVERLGRRGDLSRTTVEAVTERLLATLDAPTVRPIRMRPFEKEWDLLDLGLVSRGEDSPGDVVIDAEPGAYMTFCEPWDGRYESFETTAVEATKFVSRPT